MKKEIRILGVDFSVMNLNQASKYLEEQVINKNKTFVVTANPEILVRSYKDKDYSLILKKADIILPDGIGVVMASKLQPVKIAERVAGFDLFLELLTRAERNNLSCYFLGASKVVNDQLIINLKENYPNLIVCGNHHGFFNLNDKGIVEKVKKSKPDIIFVALGAPKQEYWIDRYIDQFESGLFIGVGGSFDVVSGSVNRAPEIWIKLNLEWLYRIIKQPKRLLRLPYLVTFIFLIVKENVSFKNSNNKRN